MKKPDQKQKRYATYVRHACENKKEGDDVASRQRNANTLYVAKHGGIIVAEYEDDRGSGATLKRPGIQKLMKDVNTALFDVVVVSDRTRIGRGTAYFCAVEILEKAGVKIEVSDRDEFNPAFDVNLQVAFGEVYADHVRRFTAVAKKEMVRKGHFAGGGIPFGYDAVTIADAPYVSGQKTPKCLVPGKFAYAITHAFAMFADGHSTYSLDDYLKGEIGESWTMQRTYAVLRNKVYTGRSAYQEVINPTAHPALVSQADFDAVQTLLETRRVTRGVSKTPPDAKLDQ